MIEHRYNILRGKYENIILSRTTFNEARFICNTKSVLRKNLYIYLVYTSYKL